MKTLSLADMSADDLYALGQQIGSIASTRPDITHQILVGIRDEVEHGPVPNGTGFGTLFEGLWKWWHHHLPDNTKATPLIPFDRRARPSGIGPTQWRFRKH